MRRTDLVGRSGVLAGQTVEQLALRARASVADWLMGTVTVAPHAGLLERGISGSRDGKSLELDGLICYGKNRLLGWLSLAEKRTSSVISSAGCILL